MSLNPVTNVTGNYASECDWELASEFYSRFRLRIFLALFTRSLPASYCSPVGAALLAPGSYRSAAATQDHAKFDAAVRMVGDSYRRLYRTLRFLDGLFAGGDDRTAALALADLAHHGAEVRLDSVDAATSQDEFPSLFNPVLIVGGAVTFVIPVFEMFDEWCPDIGPESMPEAANAWARVWFDVALRLSGDGGTREYLATALEGSDVDYAAARKIADEIEVSQRKRSYAGVRLMANLLLDLRDGLPYHERWMINFGIALFGERSVLDELLVPSHRGVDRLGGILRLSLLKQPLKSLAWSQNDRIMKKYIEVMEREERDRTEGLIDFDTPLIVRFPPNPNSKRPEWR